MRISSGGRAVVCLLALMFAIYGCEDESANKQAIDEMIKQNIPVGTERAKVVAFLDSKNIEHSGHARQNDYIVLAILRERAPSPSSVRKAVQIKFEFDQSKRLARYSLEEQFTGP